MFHYFKETIARMECLMVRRVPDGYLAKFLKKVEISSNFQGVALNDSLERKVKRIGGTSNSLQSEVDTPVDLCKQGRTG